MQTQHTGTIEPRGSVGLMARVDWRRFSTRLVVSLSAMLIGFGAVYWGSVLLLGSDRQQQYTWSADVQFLFPGVTQGQYPNGMAFVASDLISDVVLERALASLDLEDSSIDVASLSEKLAITSYFPRLDEVTREYEAQLSSDLSQVEIQELEAAFERDLRRGVRGQARIVLTSSNPNYPAEAILGAIPEAWAAYVRNDLMTLSTDRVIYTAEVISDAVFDGADFVAIYSLLRDRMNLLRQNLSVLAEASNAGLVEDPASGRRLADIEAQVDQVESIFLDNLLSQVVGLGLTRNPEKTMAFLRSRSESLERQLALLTQKSQRIEEALEDYGQTSRGDDGSGAVNRRVNATGDVFLDRLVSLGVESGDLAFRQTLTRERLALELEATAARSELRRLQALSESVSQVTGGGDEAQNAVLVDDVSEAFDQIIQETRAMFEAVSGIAEQMDVLQLGGDAALYRLNHLSTEPVALSRLLNHGTVYWFWVLTIVLALLVLTWVVGREMFDIAKRRRVV